jgi:hypothetical protein
LLDKPLPHARRTAVKAKRSEQIRRPALESFPSPDLFTTERGVTEVAASENNERTAFPGRLGHPQETADPAASGSARHLHWVGDGLHVSGRERAIVRIVPDGKYPVMWRVQQNNGHLSGMLNRTTAKDAALGLAMRMLREAKP